MARTRARGHACMSTPRKCERAAVIPSTSSGTGHAAASATHDIPTVSAASGALEGREGQGRGEKARTPASLQVCLIVNLAEEF